MAGYSVYGADYSRGLGLHNKMFFLRASVVILEL